MTENMTPDEAGEKGGMIIGKIMDIYQLIEWNDGDMSETLDPFVKISLYQSGKIMIDNYQDQEPTEFNINTMDEPDVCEGEEITG